MIQLNQRQPNVQQTHSSDSSLWVVAFDEVKYEVYLAHAHEDRSFAAGLAQSLEQRGFRVWFNSFLVGPSIREQMEEGLRNSEFEAPRVP